MMELHFSYPPRRIVRFPLVPHLHQGHGPPCAFFRHHAIGAYYAVSTIGEPHDPADSDRLAGAYETCVYALRGEARELIGRIVHRTQAQAVREHRQIYTAIRNMLEERARKHEPPAATSVLLPGLTID